MPEPQGEPERPSERRARHALERVLGQTLERVPPSNGATPDYRSANPERVFEVKELTTEEMRRFNSRVESDNKTCHPVDGLTRTWMVLFSAMNLSQDLAAKAGGVPIFNPPRRARFINLLGEVLEELESKKIYDTDNGSLWSPANEGLRARLFGLIGRGWASIDDSGAWGPGIILLGVSSERSAIGNPDILASEIQDWLSSESSANLRRSLAHEGGERHGVLVANDFAVSESSVASELGSRFRPTLPLKLPRELDVLWIVVASIVLRFGATTGWAVWDYPQA